MDLFAYGIPAPLAQTALSRIAQVSAPFADDPRSADKRRLDALVDLLLGRVRADGVATCDAPSPSTTSGCCLPGAPVPCGTELSVLVPVGAALGTTEEVAEMAGQPIEADVLDQLLLAAPSLRTVWVDPAGVPVAVADRSLSPARGDPQSVRDVLRGW